MPQGPPKNQVCWAATAKMTSRRPLGDLWPPLASLGLFLASFWHPLSLLLGRLGLLLPYLWLPLAPLATLDLALATFRDPLTALWIPSGAPWRALRLPLWCLLVRPA